MIDRLIQQALLQVLTPIFDPTFSEHSYGFRPRRKAHDAVLQAQKYIQAGYRWTVDMDLEKFLDRVNHDILMSRVARKVKDKRVLKRVRTRIRELRALKQPEWVVFMIANSRRGSWEMARNLNHAMDKAYFEELGLRSLQMRYLQLRRAS